MLLFMSTEVMFFTALIGSYIVLRFSNGWDWPSSAAMHVELWVGMVNTVMMISSSFTLLFALNAARSDLATRAKFWLLVTLLLAIGFLVSKGFEYKGKFDHGLVPFPTGSLIFEDADETYLSRVVAEARHSIQRSERLGQDPKIVASLYQIQDGVVDWTQYKVGRAADRLTRKVAIEALAYQVYPVESNDRLDKYLADEFAEVENEKQELQQRLKKLESDLKIAQQEIKDWLPARDTDEQAKQAYVNASKHAAQLTQQLTVLQKQLTPIEARLSATDVLRGSEGINSTYQIRLPMVIQNGKTWVNLYFLLTGFHVIHLLAGVVVLCGWLPIQWNRSRSHLLENFSVYWHFVDVVWLVIFAVIYLG